MASPAKTTAPPIPMPEGTTYTGGNAATGGIGRYLRVTIDASGDVALAGAGTSGAGFAIEVDTAAGEPVTIRTIRAPAYLCISSAAIAVGGAVESAASGQVAPQSAGVTIGVAKTAAGGAGEVISVYAATD